MNVELIEHNNDDLSVVNAARVSFNKTSTELNEKDIKLIQYLAKHDHFTPFTHNWFSFTVPIYEDTLDNFFYYLTQRNHLAGVRFKKVNSDTMIISGNVYALTDRRIFNILDDVSVNYIFNHLKEKLPYSFSALAPHHTRNHSFEFFCQEPFSPVQPNAIESQDGFTSLRLKVPLFVARQFDKHQVGFTKNEVSRRYVSSSPEFYQIDNWRTKAKNVKQGSSDEVFKNSNACSLFANKLNDVEQVFYEELLNINICPEQARTILPQNTYTEYWLSACLDDWIRLVNLRTKEDTQKETRDVADMTNTILKGKFGNDYAKLY